MQKAFVGNLADTAQVKDADKKVRFGRERELEDMKFILSTPQGQRVLWRYLEKARVFESIWHASALIHYNAGRQDLGHEILADITEASPEVFIKMMKDKKDGKF